jgi:hypothetical protein
VLQQWYRKIDFLIISLPKLINDFAGSHVINIFILRFEYLSFFLLVVMFIISIIFLIISPNVISILLGWDGLGFVSYLLVI